MKTINRRRCIAIIISVVLVCAVLAGCQPTNPPITSSSSGSIMSGGTFSSGSEQSQPSAADGSKSSTTQNISGSKSPDTQNTSVPRSSTTQSPRDSSRPPSTNITPEKNGITFIGNDSRISLDLTQKLIGTMKSDSDGQADSLRKSIVNAKGTLKSSGKTFYISNNGSDANNGRSPETPWATLLALSMNDFKIAAGDAVLFERGSIFRGGFVPLSGVSYGAYGSGPKPCIYGSDKNYAKETWKKTSKANVYVYALDVSSSEIGMIVFNHGEKHGVKRIESASEIYKDFDFYHDINKNLLYLYSSVGNPGKVFYDIELLGKKSIINIKANTSNVLIENLCLKYTGNFAITTAPPVSNITIRDCEIGWIGGSILRNDVRYGNAIQFWGECHNILVDRCWIYQCYDTGITHQYGGTGTNVVASNVTYSNNLIEYCSYSIEWFWRYTGTSGQNITDVEGVRMEHILIENNILRFAGYGFGNQRPGSGQVAHLVGGPTSPNRASDFVIRNNILDLSAKSLIFVPCWENAYLPTMSGNTYIQKLNADFGIWKTNERHVFDSGIASFIKSIDSKAKVVTK